MLKGMLKIILKQGQFHSADGFNTKIVIQDFSEEDSKPVETEMNFNSQERKYDGLSKQEQRK